MSGRQVIVTGASPGSMGYAAALQLARWGADVVVTRRREPDTLQQALRAELGADWRKRDGAVAGPRRPRQRQRLRRLVP